MSAVFFALLAMTAAPGVEGARLRRTSTVANPVRKVVTLLQKMQASVEAEGEKEKELMEKFMCYCKTGSGDLASSIDAAEAKITQLTADIEATTSEKEKTVEALQQAKTDRA